MTIICYPPQSCVKIKRCFLVMVGDGGGKFGKKYSFYIVRRHYITLEHDTLPPLCMGLEIHSPMNWS